MPALLYKITERANTENYQITPQRTISIAGWNGGLIYSLWEQKAGYSLLNPNHNGLSWEINKDEINNWVKNKNGKHLDSVAYEYGILFDIEPKQKRTNLKSVEHIYIFTYNYKTQKVYSSVLMFRLKDNLFSEKKSLPKDNFKLSKDRETSLHFDFLYLRGDKEGWNWGTLGRMNGALIGPDAKKFFKKHF